jgi:hypothetical protein
MHIRNKKSGCFSFSFPGQEFSQTDFLAPVSHLSSHPDAGHEANHHHEDEEVIGYF